MVFGKINLTGKTLIKLVMLSLLYSCATAPSVEEKVIRYFWPPDPDYARIEYIDFYEVEEDIQKNRQDWFEDVLLGKAAPTPLLDYPYAIDTDNEGRCYVSDLKKKAVYIFDFQKGKIDYLVNQDGSFFQFTWPIGLAVGDDYIYVSDPVRNEILKFSKQGVYVSNFGKGDLQRPTGLGYNPVTKNLYVVDTSRHGIVVYDSSDQKFFEFGQRGVSPGLFNYPLDVDFDQRGNVYVLDTMNSRVQAFTADGQFIRMFGERGTAAGSFIIPKGLDVSVFGHVYVTDNLGHKMVIFDLDGNYLLTIGGKARRSEEGGVNPGGFLAPAGVTTDREGGIYIVDSMNKLMHKFQYLTKEYLNANPILPGQTYFPVQSNSLN
jgi:DNA-binding beta-propeller fold protein YncE